MSPAGRGWRIATPEEAAAPLTRLGGRPSWSGEPRWPVFGGSALEFIGQFTHGDALILAFLSFDEDAGSAVAEGGGNAALVEPGGEVPGWVTTEPIEDGPAALGAEVLVPDGWSPGTAPTWVQRDDTPPNAPVFVAQLASFPDRDGMITFGDGGVAYLFASADGTRARLLWQTA